MKLTFALALALLTQPLFAKRDGAPTAWMEYPRLALAAMVQGSVILEVAIDKDGKIQNMVSVSGHPLLVLEAEKNMITWRFSPAEPDDPETVTERFVYQFRIDDSVEGRRMEFKPNTNTVVISMAPKLMMAESAEFVRR